MSARLLILSPTTGRGGAEMYMLTVADAALDAGWDVVVGLRVAPVRGTSCKSSRLDRALATSTPASVTTVADGRSSGKAMPLSDCSREFARAQR